MNIVIGVCVGVLYGTITSIVGLSIDNPAWWFLGIPIWILSSFLGLVVKKYLSNKGN